MFAKNEENTTLDYKLARALWNILLKRCEMKYKGEINLKS